MSISPRLNPVVEPDNQSFAAAVAASSSISDLLSKLQITFHRMEFDSVAMVLQGREDALKRHIELLTGRVEAVEKNQSGIERILQEKVKNEVELKKYVRISQDLRERHSDLEKKIERVFSEKVELEVKLRLSMWERDDFRLRLTDLEKRFNDLLVEKLEAEVAASKYKADSDELREKYADLEEKMGKIAVEKIHVEVESENRLALATEKLVDLEKEKDKEIQKLQSQVVRLSDERNKASEESARDWEEKCRPRLSKLEQELATFLHSNPEMTRTVTGPNIQMLFEDQVASGLNPSEVACRNRIPIQKQELHKPGPAETAINHVIVIDSDDDTPVNNLDDVPAIETASALKESRDGKRPQYNNDGGAQYKKSKVNSPSANISKTDEDNDSSNESINDEAINKLIKQIRTKNRTFTSEADMLSEFNKDDEFCMNAVCALYRWQKSLEHAPASNEVGFSEADATRGNALAEFVINGDSQGKPQRSLNEVEQHNRKGPKDCRRIARNHLKQLFQVYQEGKDPFFQ